LLLSDGTNDYLYGPNGTPVEQANLTTGTPEYFVADAQGSTRALLGASGSVDATFSYDAYGNLTSQTGTATTPLLYDGQYFDQTTGFYYLRARWFDPSTDQFTTVDPLVAETGQPYAYAGDDPINSSDPSGLCSFFNIWCDVFGGGRPPVCRTAICVVSPPTTWPGLGPLDVPREAYNYINSFADHGMTTRQFQTVAYLEWLETDGPNGGAAQLTQSVVAQSAGCNPTGPNAAPQYAAYACAASAVIKYRPGQFNGAKPTVYTAEQFYQDHEYTLTYLAVALNGKLLENLDKADGMDKLYEIIDKAPEVVAMATLASTFTPAATGPAPGCGTTA
jgi:RHS repeat-associated protein